MAFKKLILGLFCNLVNDYICSFLEGVGGSENNDMRNKLSKKEEKNIQIGRYSLKNWSMLRASFITN